MKDTYAKMKASYSIDKKIEKEFTALAQKLAINKSGLIEKYIERWISENKNKTLK